MTHGCGINAWETNSQIVHIVGDSPQGPFQRKDVFAPPFAHECVSFFFSTPSPPPPPLLTWDRRPCEYTSVLKREQI